MYPNLLICQCYIHFALALLACYIYSDVCEGVCVCVCVCMCVRRLCLYDQCTGQTYSTPAWAAACIYSVIYPLMNTGCRYVKMYNKGIESSDFEKKDKTKKNKQQSQMIWLPVQIHELKSCGTGNSWRHLSICILTLVCWKIRRFKMAVISNNGRHQNKFMNFWCTFYKKE